MQANSVRPGFLSWQSYDLVRQRQPVLYKRIVADLQKRQQKSFSKLIDPKGAARHGAYYAQVKRLTRGV